MIQMHYFSWKIHMRPLLAKNNAITRQGQKLARAWGKNATKMNKNALKNVKNVRHDFLYSYILYGKAILHKQECCFFSNICTIAHDIYFIK